MPLGTPHLDQITTPLDSISGSLDNDADLQKVEFNNPTLEQLDSWGTIDFIATFGNIDSLSTLQVRQGTASASTVATASADIQFAIEVDATVSTSATATASGTRIRTDTASAIDVAVSYLEQT